VIKYFTVGSRNEIVRMNWATEKLNEIINVKFMRYLNVICSAVNLVKEDRKALL